MTWAYNIYEKDGEKYHSTEMPKAMIPLARARAEERGYKFIKTVEVE